jgi:hypothetical protein
MVAGEPPRLVVLRIYNDTAVTVPLQQQPDGRYVTDDTFQIYRLSELPERSIRYMEIGQLVRVER